MRRLAHRRLAAFRDAPILFGAGAVALLVDMLAILVLRLGFASRFSIVQLQSMPAPAWMTSIIGSDAVPVSIRTLLTVTLLSSGLVLGGAAILASRRRPNRTTWLPRIQFAINALAAALLLGGGGFLLALPGEAALVRRAERSTTSKRDHELVTLIGLEFPRAIAAARARLSDPDPGVRFLYGAALQAAGHGDPDSRRAMTGAVARLRELVRADPTFYSPRGTLAGSRFLDGASLLTGSHCLFWSSALDPDGGYFWSWWDKVEPDYRTD